MREEPAVYLIYTGGRGGMVIDRGQCVYARLHLSSVRSLLSTYVLKMSYAMFTRDKPSDVDKCHFFLLY